MNKRRILTNLQRHYETPPDRPSEAVNVLVGCVQTLKQAGQRGFPAWLDRKGRRKQLRKIQESCQTKRGQKALTQLLKLTISAVQACTWVDDYWLGALPVKIESWPITEARKAAMAEGRAKAHERKKAREEAFRVRLKTTAQKPFSNERVQSYQGAAKPVADPYFTRVF